jgi:hypothetical protein
MSWAKKNKTKKHKFNASKQVVDGIEFDSRLEAFMYGRLNQLKIPFEMQYEVELMQAFRDYEGKAVRRMYMLVDFVIRKDGVTYFIDTKGFATPDAKIKYKLLKNMIHKSGRSAIVAFVKTQKEVDAFINKLI